MEFPHLSDTRFPILDNVNVYSYQNTFDYTRWVPNTKVTLTNVLWNSDYGDVVKFDTNEIRDKWFDEKTDGYEITLTANHTIPPEGGIKLPIPFDVASRYNYLFVDIPIMTSADAPIEYEEEIGIRRWYFFVDTVSSRAPNTTMFNLSLDVWTQFQNDVEIKYMFLERGHAPVAATKTEDYLANPIANNDYLLTPDVTPTNPGIVRSSNFIPFGNGEKWVCIALSMTPWMLENIGAAVESEDYDPTSTLSYEDAAGRNGYQAVVSGFGAGNGYDYSALHLRTAPVGCPSSRHRIQNNLHVWALPATDVHMGSNSSFFQEVERLCPVLMNSIRGVFVVDRDMIEFDGSTVVVAGYTLKRVMGTDQSIDIGTLSVSDFGYPERYQRFAKLYTYPYAAIELTDNEGETVEVRIENTGSITAHKVTELAFPFVNMRTFFTGINGVGSQTYSWKLLNGNDSTAEIFDGDWFECCFDHEIPCYAVYMDAGTAWYMDNFNRQVKGARQDALSQYQNSVRALNTACENSLDMNETVMSNQQASNNTMYTNADADADTLVTNTSNTTSTNTANINATIANNSAKTAFANSTSSLVDTENAAKMRLTTNAANLASISTAIQNNETTAAVSWNSGAAGVIGGVGGAIIGGLMYAGLPTIGAGAAAGAAAGGAAGSVAPGIGNLAGVAGGAAVGALVGLVNSAASWGASDLNADSVIQANTAAVAASASSNASALNATINGNSGVTTLLNGERSYNTNSDNSLLSANTARSNSNLTTNNGNTAATMRNNAARSKNTGNNNATSYRNTADNNATYTQGTLVQNSKRELQMARRHIDELLYDARNGVPKSYGSYAGNPTADYMRTRGIQMKVRTMPDSEVRQVGDWFARYGYKLEQAWDVSESGLCPMKHFCYWKCRDAWVDDMRSSNNAATVLITAMFNRGVTIWKDPDEVGRVSIYAN